MRWSLGMGPVRVYGGRRGTPDPVARSIGCLGVMFIFVIAAIGAAYEAMSVLARIIVGSLIAAGLIGVCVAGIVRSLRQKTPPAGPPAPGMPPYAGPYPAQSYPGQRPHPGQSYPQQPYPPYPPAP